jgi:hypothetical protein
MDLVISLSDRDERRLKDKLDRNIERRFTRFVAFGDLGERVSLDERTPKTCLVHYLQAIADSNSPQDLVNMVLYRSLGKI